MIKMIHSVYIHIPFCKHICSYCDFCKVLYDSSLVDAYLAQLALEVKEKYQQEEIRTIYIGGGTPSSLTLAQLQRLFTIIDSFQLAANCEITIEANFDSLTEEKIAYLSQKVNRISLGVETISSKLQSVIGRVELQTDIRKKISLLRQYQINNINLDIMYALPGETLADVEADVDFLLPLDVPHISAYSLILEDHTLLSLQKPKLISEELDEKMYRLIETKLEKAGYHHYEVSNYAKPGSYACHNLVYWTNQYYYGFGVGAASYLPGKRITNSRSLTKYLQGIRDYEQEIITNQDAIEYEIIVGLRLASGIDKQAFMKRYQIPLSACYAYQSLVEKGLLEETRNHVLVTKSYQYVLNEVILQFLDTKIANKCLA